MNPSYSTLLPSSIGDQLGDLVRGVNTAQIDGYADWFNRFVKPGFGMLVGAKIDPALAAGIILGDGAPTPAQVKDLRLRYDGAVTTIGTKRTQTGLEAKLGFSFAGMTLEAGYDRTVDEAASQASQAAATMTLTVGPVAGAEFTKKLAEALSIGSITELPDFPRVAELPALPSG